MGFIWVGFLAPGRKVPILASVLVPMMSAETLCVLPSGQGGLIQIFWNPGLGIRPPKVQTTERHVPQTPYWNWNGTDCPMWRGDACIDASAASLRRAPIHLASVCLCVCVCVCVCMPERGEKKDSLKRALWLSVSHSCIQLYSW